MIKNELWILTDEILGEVGKCTNPQYEINSWFVVLGGSPEKVETSRKWEKERNLDACMQNMRKWKWHEIVSGFTYEGKCLERGDC